MLQDSIKASSPMICGLEAFQTCGEVADAMLGTAHYISVVLSSKARVSRAACRELDVPNALVHSTRYMAPQVRRWYFVEP